MVDDCFGVSVRSYLCLLYPGEDSTMTNTSQASQILAMRTTDDTGEMVTWIVVELVFSFTGLEHQKASALLAHITIGPYRHL